MPVDYICSQSDLIIHHCGSGMYHIPILNEKPSITIGTQCFDREIIASRLAELGISKHTPSRIDNINYLKIFNSNLDLFESESLTNMKRIKELKNEIIKVKSNFNLSAVLNS